MYAPSNVRLLRSQHHPVETTANDLDREAHHDRATAISHGTGQAQRQAKQALEAADRYVHAQPWEAIGIAAIAGLAMGVLLGRR